MLLFLLFQAVCWMALVICVWTLVRNEYVARYRERVLDEDYKSGIEHIHSAPWRGEPVVFSHYESLPSYEEMLFSPWRWPIKRMR